MVVCTRGAVRGPECIPSGDSRLVIEGTNLFVKWLSAADKEGSPGMGKLRPGGHIRPVKLFNLARQTWKILYFYIIVNLVLFSLQFTLYSTIDLCWGVVDYSTFAIHSLILQILQMSGAKKRDVDSECRVFNKEWTINFFFSPCDELSPCSRCRHHAMTARRCSSRALHHEFRKNPVLKKDEFHHVVYICHDLLFLQWGSSPKPSNHLLLVWPPS